MPFLVEDYFVPSGCFGDSVCKVGVLAIDRHACDEQEATVQGVCRVYTYTPSLTGEDRYLGILFQRGDTREGEIGKVPGLPVQPGAKRLVFFAKVGAGKHEVDFRAGGANNWDGKTNPALPYKDSFGVPLNVTLGTRYEQLVIDLTEAAYTEVVSPFGFSIPATAQNEPVSLYISDVRWE